MQDVFVMCRYISHTYIDSQISPLQPSLPPCHRRSVSGVPGISMADAVVLTARAEQDGLTISAGPWRIMCISLFHVAILIISHDTIWLNWYGLICRMIFMMYTDVYWLHIYIYISLYIYIHIYTEKKTKKTSVSLEICWRSYWFDRITNNEQAYNLQ